MPLPDARPSPKIAKLFPQVDPSKDQTNGAKRADVAAAPSAKDTAKTAEPAKDTASAPVHPTTAVAQASTMVPLPEARPNIAPAHEARRHRTYRYRAADEAFLASHPGIGDAAASQAQPEPTKSARCGTASPNRSNRCARSRASQSRRRLRRFPYRNLLRYRSHPYRSKSAGAEAGDAVCAAAGTAGTPRAFAIVPRQEADRRPARPPRQ